MLSRVYMLTEEVDSTTLTATIPCSIDIPNPAAEW